MTGRATNSNNNSNSNRKSKEPTASQSSTPAQSTRRRVKKAIIPAQSIPASIASSQAKDPTGKGKPNIRWSSKLLEQLANCIAHDYSAYKTASNTGNGQA